MVILNKLPIYDRHANVVAPVGIIGVRPGQIIFRASLVCDEDPLPNSEPTFPVLLDSGSNFNFAIRKSQLELWTKQKFKTLGTIMVNKQVVPLHKANLWIHPNIKGTNNLAGKKPFLITMKGGMAVYPDDQNPTRLPILGLRAIINNKLKLIIDGKNRSVDLKRGWF